MPSVRKMTSEEIARVEAKKAAAARSYATAYEEIARELIPGDQIELELDPDESPAIATTLLEEAAGQQDPPLRLEFTASSDPLVICFTTYLQNPPLRAQIPSEADLPDLLEFDEPQPRFSGPMNRPTTNANRKQRVERTDQTPRRPRNPNAGPSESRNPRNMQGTSEQRRPKQQQDRSQWQSSPANGQSQPRSRRVRGRG